MIGFEHCDNVKRYLKFKAPFRQVIPIKPLSRFTMKKSSYSNNRKDAGSSYKKEGTTSRVGRTNSITTEVGGHMSANPAQLRTQA